MKIVKAYHLHCTTCKDYGEEGRQVSQPFKMRTEMLLLIVLCVLAGLVVLLALIYAYIYCVKMRPSKRPRGDADTMGGHHHVAVRHDDGDGSSRRNPFLLLHYVKKHQDTGI